MSASALETASAGEVVRLVAVSVEDEALRHRVLAVLGRDGIPAALSSPGLRPDVAVVGERRSPAATARAIEQARRAAGTVPVVLVVRSSGAAARSDPGLADGVLLESTLETALPAAVRAVHAGLRVEPQPDAASAPRPVFSPREKEVLALLVLGFSNAEIAQRLHLTEATVKSHLSSCFRKLAVHSRSEACARILDPDGGLGLGILGISRSDFGAPLEPAW